MNRVFLFSLSAVLMTLCYLPLRANAEESIQWSPIFKGIEYARVETTEPLMKICLLRIDTAVEGIEFHTTGRHPDYKEVERETDRRTTVEYLQENKLSVAVNANFYTPFNAFTRMNRGASDVLGLAVSDGIVVSKTAKGYPSFLVYKDGKKEIRIVPPEESTDKIQTAVSGSNIVLKDGVPIKEGKPSIHPRTAIGISKDGRYVYMMTIDGRQSKYSVGATLEQVAQWLKKAGASDGLNLDGGGSTTMVKSIKDGKPKVLNHPVGLGPAGTLRHNANNIGVRAPAL